MFTATLSGEIKDTCRKFMRNPTEVLIENENSKDEFRKLLLLKDPNHSHELL